MDLPSVYHKYLPRLDRSRRWLGCFDPMREERGIHRERARESARESERERERERGRDAVTTRLRRGAPRSFNISHPFHLHFKCPGQFHPHSNILGQFYSNSMHFERQKCEVKTDERDHPSVLGTTLSHTVYSLDGFRMSTPPQNRQLIVYCY